MSLTARDRKIALVLVPIVVLAGYWFLLLAPKRDEAAKAGDTVRLMETRPLARTVRWRVTEVVERAK